MGVCYVLQKYWFPAALHKFSNQPADPHNYKVGQGLNCEIQTPIQALTDYKLAVLASGPVTI
jgi:hypothetical protein